ncbi:zinc-binding dehydrogenase [Nonomuraea sp. SYSU D8015]|uniref:zinc-binding dehydrogenase n=1 Tax=Nonomuraea sp. SYSU D8015 TaxID=2593644 RepID=UPI001CB6E779|nr:zinc-binding dehydrogenase [Nonomuraea sp. SYSU D8015]
MLITGAAGGVGRYAVQLAALGGAHVIASVGSPARADGLAELGPDEVVIGLDGVDRPVDLILDNVGGPQLAAAWKLLAPGGGVQNIGWASDEPAVFEPYSLFSIGPAKTMSTFGDVHEVGPDLGTLLGFVAAGRLSPEVDWRGPMTATTPKARNRAPASAGLAPRGPCTYSVRYVNAPSSAASMSSATASRPQDHISPSEYFRLQAASKLWTCANCKLCFRL